MGMRGSPKVPPGWAVPLGGGASQGSTVAGACSVDLCRVACTQNCPCGACAARAGGMPPKSPADSPTRPVLTTPADAQHAMLFGIVGRGCGAYAALWRVVCRCVGNMRKRAPDWPQHTAKSAGIALESGGAAGQGTAGHSPHFPQPTLHLKRPCVVSGSEALAARPIAERPGGTGRVGSRCVSTPHRDPHVGVRLRGAARKHTGCASHPAHRPENGLYGAHRSTHLPGPGRPTDHAEGQAVIWATVRTSAPAL